MARNSLKLLFLRKYRSSKKQRGTSKSKSSAPLLAPGNEYTISSSRTSSIAVPSSAAGVPSGGSNGNAGRRRVPGSRNNSQVDTVDCCVLLYDCFSLYKQRVFVFLVVAGLVSTTGLYMHNQRLSQYKIYREDVFSPQHGIRLKRCTIPDLKPFSKQVQPFISYGNPPNCAHEQGNDLYETPFTLKNGSLLVRNLEIDSIRAECCYRPFHRNGERGVWTSNYCKPILTEITQIPQEIEYLEVLCINDAIRQDFRDAFSIVPEKVQVEDRIAEFEELTPPEKRLRSMSVLILGLDATSRMNFIRAMPKSNKYLLQTLSAIPLRGYTKVAENTLPNVVPFLTGRTLEEFKKLCVDESRVSDNVNLDGCPFIWKVFAGNGYRTGFSEDNVNIGIFNMNWGNAFGSPPTDYYLRPFSLRMEKEHSYKDGYCYGTSLSFEKLLENIRSMAEAFHDKPYFQFTWSTKLSHDDINKMRWGDEPLYQLLRHLSTNNYLNNTALLLVGDHGSRLDRIRSTDQGKLEDRMPLAYIVLPPWFRKKYPRAYSNLKRNGEEVVTSAFDMHKTLYDFMNLDRLNKNLDIDHTFDFDNLFALAPRDVVQLPHNESVDLSELRGSSLFRRLGRNRTCFMAGIPLHWCICHRKIPQDTESDIAKDAAEFIVTSLNTHLNGYGSCATLELKSIDEMSKWDPKEIIREGCEEYDYNEDNTTNSSNSSLVSGNGECDPNSKVLVLQISFTTSPGDAAFETTVIQLAEGGWKLTEDVVRTNSYEGQSVCVEQKMKPYCYCVDDD